jgi:hypothetical protein
LPVRGRDHSGPVMVHASNANAAATGASHQYRRTFETGCFFTLLLLRDSRAIIEIVHRAEIYGLLQSQF